MRGLIYRCAASAVLGVILFMFYFWRFLPYSMRMRNAPSPWPFLIIMLVSGFLLTLGMARRRFWVCTCLLLTLCAANQILIVIDTSTDPTTHNLLPFEFVAIAVLTLPAYLGAAIAAAIYRFRARGAKA